MKSVGSARRGVDVAAHARRRLGRGSSRRVPSRVALFLGLAAVGLGATGCGEPGVAQRDGPAERAIPPLDGSAERIDEYLTRAAAFGFSGAVLVARAGEVVLHAGYGDADRQAGLPVTPETVFSIGSITKQFTAAAILALEEAGALRVEDPISRHFEDVPADKRGITIHHLLTHSSGLEGDFGGDYERMPRDSLVRLVLESELLWEPGTRYRYSNAGYSLLGAIVEKASGRGYERYLRERLFEPAGLERTGYLTPDWSGERVAVGYRRGERWGTPLDHAWAEDGPWWNLRANGGLLSSAGDLHRWHRALESDRVLSAASREKLFTPHVPENEEGTSHYGYGWAITPTSRGTTLIWHNGGNGVFFADFRRYVDEDAVLVFLTNEASGETVGSGIVRLMFGDEVPMPPAAEAEPAEAVLRRYAGTYRLPTGVELEVRVVDGQLRAHASDPEAAALFVPLPAPPPEAAALVEGIERRTAGVVDALAAGDPGPFREAYLEEGGPDVEGEVEFWAGAFRFWEERLGEYAGSTVLASTAGSGPQGETVDTHVVVRFERGARLIAFRQAIDGDPAGFYLDAIPPDALPETFRLVPLSETEFATFHFGFGVEGRARFEVGAEGRADALRIGRAEGDVVARRVRD